MPEPTREELMAENEALKRQLAIQQSGSGAIAQGTGAVAAGAGGFAVGGDFHGNIYVGTPPANDAEAIAIYRRMLIRSCRQLPLRGVHVGASDPSSGEKQIDLDQVYVSLDTTSPVIVPTEKSHRQRRELGLPDQESRRFLSALEVAVVHRNVVILGDPGSGKSTFLNHLGLCLALHGLEPKNRWCDRLAGWPEQQAALLPIPVVLRDFARSLPDRPDRAEAETLWNFITSRLGKQKLDAVAKPLEHALDAGKAIVLLDGLDEVSTPAHRRFVRDAVAAFADRFNASRVVVTCRTLSYQNRDWQLPDFPAVTLAPFDAPKIDQFIAAWFADLKQIGVVKPDDAEPLASELQRAIRRPDLWRLASNPLLLTVMALVHTHKGRLPEARALLYEDTVDILLWRWEQIKLTTESESAGLRRLLMDANRSDVDLKRTLWRLAYEAHRVGGSKSDLADIGELQLQTALAELHPQQSRDWAAQMIEAMKLRAGLLLERLPQVFTFPHRTFQEYLAGAHLASQANFARESALLADSGVHWREVILLGVGKLVYLHGDTDKPLALVGELCPEQLADEESAWRKAWLAGDVLGEVGLVRVKESQLGKDLVARARQRLVRLLDVGALSPVERAAAGTALGRLGDPRPGVGAKNGLPDIEWIEIPPGAFLMGEGKEQFTCDSIRQPYRVSRHAITVAQYQCFVDAGGYAQERFWTEAGWKWRDQRNVTRPEDDEAVYQTPNHPRVGVSWYEAVAFSRWLSEQLGFTVTLPSEAEWERAARHTDGRVYPWGNEDEAPQRCNMSETGIGHTSPVGIFPGGLAVCGAADMAGNVWEWCRTIWRDGYRDYERYVDDALETEGARVLRGGAFSGDRGSVRCACRNGNDPGGRHGYIGFRVVASPFDSGR